MADRLEYGSYNRRPVNPQYERSVTSAKSNVDKRNEKTRQNGFPRVRANCISSVFERNIRQDTLESIVVGSRGGYRRQLVPIAATSGPLNQPPVGKSKLPPVGHPAWHTSGPGEATFYESRQTTEISDNQSAVTVYHRRRDNDENWLLQIH
uniref:Uncharacterized protein n=1 Tax=Vespula pensylvanica TaxID=30213 RepID=A0A834P5Z2_VESPE|nr:hypothetical protein H0235_006052 [Vespula pensylvanica]